MFNLHHWLILHGRYTCVARNHKCGSYCSKTKTCQDLQHKFQELIKAYNLGAYTAEEFFNRLKAFITELEHEDKRTVREGLTEEELAVYDLMIQKAPLTEKERNQIKEIANDLTDKMKEILVIDWRKKQRTKTRVKNLIEEIVDSLPESYDDDLWPKTCSEVYNAHLREVSRARPVCALISGKWLSFVSMSSN